MDAVRESAAAFAKAFNEGDAKAVAGFWTTDGEYASEDGLVVRGRDSIEKAYTQFFRQHPQARIEAEISEIRLLGRFVAQEQGHLKLFLPDATEPEVSRYSVLHVWDDGQWRIAVSREWTSASTAQGTLENLDWLVGEWQAVSDQGELRISYVYDDSKTFLRSRYTLWRGGEQVSSGIQLLGNSPNGGVQSWSFDSSGVTGQSRWVHDHSRWFIQAADTLPDGSHSTAVNLLVPINGNTFTWQSVERTIAGVSLPNTPPVKVIRVTDSK